MRTNKTRISRRIGRFVWDRRAVSLLIIGSLALAGWGWLKENPQHDPWAPLDLRDPAGFATERKLATMRGDAELCRDVLQRSEVSFQTLAPQGEGACARPDRTVLDAFPYASSKPPTTCAIAASMQIWMEQVVQPAAKDLFGDRVAKVSHLGSYSCRRLYGRDSGAWSEHATGNAIDISGFTLSDGTSVSVLNDWDDDGDKAKFLRRVRDGACTNFGTVLSPDYNAAHRDHFHFDQAARNWNVCR